MAIPKIKATYSLDELTVKRLGEVAKRWNTSKSDALTRLINQSAQAMPDDSVQLKLAALSRAEQAVSQLPPGVWENWKDEVREIHNAFGPQEDDEPGARE